MPFEKERSPSFYFGNLSSYYSSYDDIFYNYDKEPGRYKVFKYLDNKNIQMINLVCDHHLYDPNDPYRLYNYLNNEIVRCKKYINHENGIKSNEKHDELKVLNKKAFYLLSEESRYKDFKYLDKKDINAFLIIPEEKRSEIFNYLDKKDIKAFELIPEYDRCDYEGSLFKYTEEKNLDIFRLIPYRRRHIAFRFLKNKDLEAFKYIPEDDRCKVFQYLEKKGIEEFKHVPENDRCKVFQYLEKRNIEEFKLVPENDRCKVFQYLEVKDMEAFKFVPEQDLYGILEYMDRDSINDLKIMVCNGFDLDDIFKKTKDNNLNQLKEGSIKFIPSNYYYSDSNYYSNENSGNDFKILKDDLSYKYAEIGVALENNYDFIFENKVILEQDYNQILDVVENRNQFEFQVIRNNKECLNKNKIEQKSIENNIIYFDRISKQCRWCIFNYVDNKNIDSFKLIPEEDRFCCFRYLKKKTLEEFKCIPEEDRFRCFKYLDEKTIEVLNYIRQEDKNLISDNDLKKLEKEKEKEKK